MRVILSPAKKMNVVNDGLDYAALPRFLPETELLLARLRSMSFCELQALWRCSDLITSTNVRRLENMDLEKNLTPALLAYDGLQYLYMAPVVFESDELDHVKKHVRILSGFYGLLCPLDGVVPHRLEMQAKLRVNGHKDLYSYWGGKLAKQLAEETDLIVDLASQEYSRAVLPHLPPEIRQVKCIFGKEEKGRILQKGTLCKMARGRMVRYLAENDITTVEDIKSFGELGYRFSQKHSSGNHMVFIKGKE